MPMKDAPDERLIRRPPATTPLDRTQQMGAYADALAEKQLLDGSASSQLILFYAKQVSRREELELEKIRQENMLLQQKRDDMASNARAEDMMAEVFSAMKKYAGVDEDEE
jgi:hypothetical protein